MQPKNHNAMLDAAALAATLEPGPAASSPAGANTTMFKADEGVKAGAR